MFRPSTSLPAWTSVQALPLLTAAAGFERLEGRLKASVQVTGSGANTEVFARSLNGPVNVVFSDGAIRGIDVAGLVRNVQSLISSGGYTENTEAKTEFTELSVAINIAERRRPGRGHSPAWPVRAHERTGQHRSRRTNHRYAA